MDPTTENLIKTLRRAREVIETATTVQGAADGNIEPLLASYRTASENLIFHDYGLACSLEVEKHLWSSHTKVNSKFRERLQVFQKGEGKKRVVERRKAEKLYLAFIKSSQSFYRGLIQRLASHFADVNEVVEVARRIASDTLSIDKPTAVDASQKQLVLRSCHSSLIQLGDLSRYRETVLNSKDKNWGPAKGYYQLAITVLPNSGSPYNQLAVIAQADQDAFGSTYYFYRALMQSTPHPNAQSNLELQFKKTIKLWDRPENHSVKDGIFTNFQSRFAAFHAKCYSGVVFDEYRDLETELIHEITSTLLQTPNPVLLGKLCLTNISAETAALERLASRCEGCGECRDLSKSLSCAIDQRAMQAFHSFQSFNLKLVLQLLRVLAAELQRIKKLMESSEMIENGKLTPVVRCLLPILRQYSSWLLAEVPLLVILDSQKKDGEVSSFQPELAGVIQELWEVYVDVLAGLATLYPLRDGQSLEYLLAEDEETIAFKPFADDLVQLRYRNGDGEMKASSTNSRIVKQEPVEEMVHRVRQIVKDGMTIAKNTKLERIVPVQLKDGFFVYIPPEPTKPPISSTTKSQSIVSGIAGEVISDSRLSLGASNESSTDLIPMDIVMQDMVDDLLEDNRRPSQRAHKDAPITTNHRPKSARGNEAFTAADLVQRIQSSSQNSPSQKQHIQQSWPKPTTAPPTPFGISTFLPSSDSFHNVTPAAVAATAGPPPALSSSQRLSQHLSTTAATQAPPRQALPAPSSPSNPHPQSSFTTRLLHQRAEIQTRSSPPRSLMPQPPSSWTTYATPTGFNSLLLPLDGFAQQQQPQQQVQQRSPSSWSIGISPAVSPRLGYSEVMDEDNEDEAAEVDDEGDDGDSTIMAKPRIPRRNVFGAIGEGAGKEVTGRGGATPMRTPTSAQPQ